MRVGRKEDKEKLIAAFGVHENCYTVRERRGEASRGSCYSGNLSSEVCVGCPYMDSKEEKN